MNEPRVAILGTVELVGPARTTSLAGTNLPALLSLLALSVGRPVHNDRLISALWPDGDPERARRSLTSLVHQLNATLKNQLGLHKAVVSMKSVGRVLRVDPNVIDVVQFERRLADGDAQVVAGRLSDAIDTYQSALGLWRGEPFGGVDLPCFVEPSTHLRMARLRGETALIEASLRTRRGAALVPWLLQRLDADPFDEQVAADTARALYQAGRSSKALDVLRTCIDDRRSRGIEPSSDLRQLELDVLDHSLDQASRSSSSPPDGGCIGRHMERTALDEWHEGSTESSIMVINGEAGIGKTALIDAWLDGRDDGELVVRGRCSADQRGSLEAFSGLSDAAADVAEDLSATARHEQFDQIVRHIASLPAPVILLVIDDAQWLTVASIALLRHVLWHADVQRLHVVLAVRWPEVDDNSALTQLLSDATRARLLNLVNVVPFGRSEMHELIARHPTATTDAQALLRLTGGNPQFAVSVLSAAGYGANLAQMAVPPDVHAVLARFVEPLDGAAWRIIEAAAVLGVDGDAAQLATKVGATELEVMDALDEVGGGRLMHVEPIGGSYAFVHELARRSVLAGRGKIASRQGPRCSDERVRTTRMAR